MEAHREEQGAAQVDGPSGPSARKVAKEYRRGVVTERGTQQSIQEAATPGMNGSKETGTESEGRGEWVPGLKEQTARLRVWSPSETTLRRPRRGSEEELRLAIRRRKGPKTRKPAKVSRKGRMQR